MTERPILFSAPMVRAILAGAKTQTRRVMPQPETDALGMVRWRSDGGYFAPSVAKAAVFSAGLLCRYGVPGDRLWVRETWSPYHRDVYPCIPYVYRASASFSDGEAREHRFCDFEKTGVRHFECLACAGFKWRPSIHMSRAASRITLEITDVRIERLQDLSEADAKAEGVESRLLFVELWDAINGKRAPWASNPWLWVVSFKRVQP